MKKQSIVFIVGTLAKGGVERQLFYIIKSLIKLKFEVNILCFTKNEFWEFKLKELGINTIYCGKYNSRLLKLFKIANFIFNKKIDIIYSVHFYTNLYATIIGVLFNIPSISSVRSDFYSEQRKIGALLTFFSIKLSSITIANSRNAINNAKNKIKNHNWEYLPNAIDSKHFSSSKLKTNVKKGRYFRILMVARLTREKRVDFFLELISMLKTSGEVENIKIKSFVAGSGRIDEDLKKDLLNTSISLGLDDNDINFLGDVNDMSSLYKKCDLLLLTSEREGSPNCILEAMSSGLPVIANDVGGVSELVENNKNGYIIQPFNRDLFLLKLVELINDDGLRLKMGRNGRQRILETHTIEINIKILLKIFNTVSK